MTSISKEETLSGVLLKKEYSKNKLTKEDMDVRLAEWRLFYLSHLEIFVEDFLEIPLKEFQRQFLSDCSNYDYLDFIASRGLGKSFCIAIAAVAFALLNPGMDVLITSLTISQGNSIVVEKIDKLLTNPDSVQLRSPILKQLRKDGYIQIGVDATTQASFVKFGNGSQIFVVNSGESARGKRSHIVIGDEAVLIKESVYNGVIKPTTQPYKWCGYEAEPKEFLLTSARTKDNWVWKHLKNCVNMHYKQKDSKYGFFMGDIFTAVASEIQSKNQYLNRKSTTNEFTFETEYLNVWLGESDGAIFKYQQFLDAQTLEKAFIPKTNDDLDDVKFEIPQDENIVRLMSVDIAVVGGSQNDNTVITLGTINVKTGKRKIEYITSKNGLNSDLQVMLMKRLFYEYGCHYIVIDTKGVGNVIFDMLITETKEDIGNLIDWERFPKGHYPAWNVCEDNSLQISSSTVINEKLSRTITTGDSVIIPVAGTSDINSAMHYSMWDTLRGKKLELLKDINEITVILEDRDPTFVAKSSEERAKVLVPFQETNYLISETISLNTVMSPDRKLTVKENSNATKDRYMSLAMFNYLSEKLVNKYVADQHGEDDWDVSDFAEVYRY